MDIDYTEFESWYNGQKVKLRLKKGTMGFSFFFNDILRKISIPFYIFLSFMIFYLSVNMKLHVNITIFHIF